MFDVLYIKSWEYENCDINTALSENYGGILQNYALQVVLKRLGHNCCTIHYSRQTLLFATLLWCKYFLKCIIRHPGRNSKPPTIGNCIHHRRDHVAPFVRKHIVEATPKRGLNSNMDFLREFDAFIVGSDQTWRPMYSLKDELYYKFLDFVPNDSKAKRISYAASFGTDCWEYTDEQTKKCKCLIQKFNAISVREAIGIDFCNRYFAVEAQHVLDPTLLLSADDYRSLISADEYIYKGDVCVYVLDITDDKQRLIDNFCKKNNVKPYRVGTHLGNGCLPSIENWLASFDHAKYVITDSFHGSVFSIIFNKPFVTIGNKERGMSRFNSLLKQFNLEDRLLVDEQLDCITTPNWDKVNNILNECRKKSIFFLQNSLK